ncbi:Putative zn(2)-C6 fungal-type DNA-binding domain-containing protein [Septoria linicola]|uniref:Zn(2)-C6 fungal-type DNA-binding domain-containing protein n=1 Tax=Septoria linicola TaxID=215465 RepID=A0A9Q9EQJ3_9PEZI|nr:putative zn(2)-C6 fungal-type DNA-binding domain-containing protein [Septoria linicola]USW58862.1 Putative zn(2)-C6 fungal-type DNA-binding domain-containing protein [Septoria linicola]
MTAMMEPQFHAVKRSYHQMLDHVDTNLAFDGVSVAYHEMSRGGYYTPPPPAPHHTLFSSNPFPSSSPDVGYVEEGYLPSEPMYSFSGNPNRSMSESYPHDATHSFGSASSTSSSCNVSLGPSTPPPQQYHSTMTKLSAVPITPSHVQPRQKAKRTATACEECRKRKQKCDGEQNCQSCKDQKLECKYREVLPTKKDNSMERLVSLVEMCKQSMEALNQRLDLMSTTLQSIEKRLTRCHQCAGTVELETGNCNSCNNQVPCRL